MELLKISDTKLKIILTPSDMNRYELSDKELDYENQKSRRALQKILKEAKSRVGFEDREKRILMQAFPSRDGGCELYVTALCDETEADLSESSRILPALPRRGETILHIQSTETLIKISSLLYETGFSGESRLYWDDEGYYLFLIGGGDIPFLAEFADSILGPSSASYISEYKRCLLEKEAISTIQRLK